MFTSGRSAKRAAVLTAATIWTAVSPVHAGPFLNWLFGRPVTVYANPPVAGYPAAVTGVPGLPTTTMYAPAVAAPTPIAGGAAYVTPGANVLAPTATTTPVVTQYAPTASVVPAYATAPTVVAHAPVIAAPVAVQPVMTGYTTYRTTWNRIPVTYYRPVTAYQAGYAVTAMQPCNTYTWQAQRVPARWHHRPWVPFSSAAPVTLGYAPAVVAAPTVAAPVAAAPCATCPSAVGYSAAPAASIAPTLQVPANYPPATSAPLYSGAVDAAQVPAYQTPAYQTPAYQTPAYATESNPVPGYQPAPGYPAPGVQSPATQMPAVTQPAIGTGVAPADQAPQLLPGNYSNPSGLDLVPQTIPRTNGTNGTTNGTNGSVNVGPAASTVPADSASTQRPVASPYSVTPIPAPDVRTYDSHRPVPQAPPLLHRDRTAVNSAGETRIVGQASYVTAKPTVPAPAAAQKVLWDDSGWRTAK